MRFLEEFLGARPVLFGRLFVKKKKKACNYSPVYIQAPLQRDIIAPTLKIVSVSLLLKFGWLMIFFNQQNSKK